MKKRKRVKRVSKSASARPTRNAKVQGKLITDNQLREILKKRMGKKFLKVYAAELGISFQFLGKVLKGEYFPGPTIGKALGYEQVILFRRVSKPSPKAEKVKAPA